LVYNYFRDYDPVVGRYAQSDPIGLAGGLNPYLYANGNPLRYADPYGLFGFSDATEAVFGVVWRATDWSPEGSADFAAGWGDTLSFDITRRLRELGDIGAVDTCSRAYAGGKLFGVANGLAMGGAGLARGGLRMEMGNFKHAGQWFFRPGTRGPHFHFGVGGGLQTHHLPWQAANWGRNLWGLIKRGEAGQDLANLAAIGYGAAVATSGAIPEGCGCE
jgi:hypothetical protein